MSAVGDVYSVRTVKVPTGLVAAVVALLLGNVFALVVRDGGSSDVEQGGRAAADAMPSAPPTSVSATDPTTASSPGSAPASKPPPAPAPSSTTTRSAPADAYVYVVTLTPLCARVGETMTITLRLKPGAAGVVQVAYTDGPHDTQYVGRADGDGVFTRSWPAPAAPGPGLAMTAASDPETQRGGTTSVEFRIVGVGESC